MRSKCNLTIFFAVAVIIISFIAGFFAWQNQKLVKELREVAQATTAPSPTIEPSTSPVLQIANPAAVFCINQGGESSIKTGEDGGQTGLCTINGKVYDEWEYFRNNYESPSPSPTASSSATPCSRCNQTSPQP